MAFPGTVSIPIQFTGGLNSKMSEFSLQQPYLQKLENGVYNQIGQIDKRTGFTAVSTNIQGGGNISQGATITTFNNELLLLDGGNIYSYQEEEDVWINKGTAISTINNQTRIINTKIATQSNPDCTSLNNISVYAWEDNRVFPAESDGIRYSVLNNQTGTIILSDQLVYSHGIRPKCINDGYNIYIIYVASSDTILSNAIPISAPNTIQPFNIICRDGYSSTSNNIPYDATIYNGAPLIVYLSQTGLKTNISPTILSSNMNIQTIGVCVDSFNRLWISFSDNTATYVGCWIYDPFISNFVVILNPITIAEFGQQVSANLALIEGVNEGSLNLTTEVIQHFPAGQIIANNNYINNFVVDINGTFTFIGQQRGVGLASKPFKYNGNIFINTLAQSNLQSTYFTQCLTKGTGFISGTSNIEGLFNSEVAVGFTVVSKHSPTTGGNYRNNGLLSQADILSNESFLFAGQRKGAFTSYQNAQTTNLGVAGFTIDFNSQDTFNNVQSNNNLHLVGGIKKIYDGVSCVEDNFNLFPELPDGYGCDIQLIGSGQFPTNGQLTYNPLTQPNQYQYIVVYEWTDNYGQVQRSGPSVANTVVTTQTGQGASLTGPMLRLTDKVSPRSPISISIYRTQVSLPVFYKITNDNNPLVNDTTKDFWEYFDDLSDEQIGANENLYTNSQLGNIAPPSCSLISLYQQRLMINSNEDPGVLWYSQNKFEQDQYNTLSLDWNTSFVEGIDSRLGNTITAIGLLDNSLAIFKNSSIFILQGDGPNSLDTSGQFNDAQLLVSDTGCNNQNSLCFITQTPSSPGGLLFKSPKGIYLLGRDESLTYIGAPVEQFNNLTITSANLLAKSNEVVFTTLEGTALVYNYYFNAWSTWQNLPAVSACVWNNQLILLQSNGGVLIQDITNTIYQDTLLNNIVQPISLSITTPWINVNGLQGYQSVFNCLLLGTLQGPHILQVEVGYDYNPSITESVLINSSLVTNRWGSNSVWGSQGLWGSPQFANYQFQINVSQNRCEAIQFTFSDVNNTAFSQGYSLNGLVLECLTLPGNFRVPVSNIVGAQ